MKFKWNSFPIVWDDIKEQAEEFQGHDNLSRPFTRAPLSLRENKVRKTKKKLLFKIENNFTIPRFCVYFFCHRRAPPTSKLAASASFTMWKLESSFFDIHEEKWISLQCFIVVTGGVIEIEMFMRRKSNIISSIWLESISTLFAQAQRCEERGKVFGNWTSLGNYCNWFLAAPFDTRINFCKTYHLMLQLNDSMRAK